MTAVEAAVTDRVRRRVVVIGGGFAGLNAAMGLADLSVDVTLVDRKNYHTFQPLLYQVALAVLSPADIAQPIRSILRDHPHFAEAIEAIARERYNLAVSARQLIARK